MLLHSGKQGGYCVQVLFCLLDLTGPLGMTKDQSTHWGERDREGVSSLGKFLTTSGVTLFSNTALFGFGENLASVTGLW